MVVLWWVFGRYFMDLWDVFGKFVTVLRWCSRGI